MSEPRANSLERRVPLGRRLIAHDRLRFAITITGVGFSVVLMLFLLALYEGVRIESNGYIAARPSQAWVTQDNTTNFIKSSSFLRASAADSLRSDPNVAEVTPLLRLITTVRIGATLTTAIVVGIDPHSSLPAPDVVVGTARLQRGDIVMDQALVRRYGARLHDSLEVQGQKFRLVGLSRGTNAVLTQLAFIPLEDATTLLGFRDVASFLLVRSTPGVDPSTLTTRIRGRIRHTNAFTQEEFTENNMRELRGGLLPILASVAVLGGIVGLSVLSLLLYGSILERREEYALLKAIGAPDAFLARLVFVQSLAAVSGGVLFGTLVYALGAPLVRRAVPVIVLSLNAPAVVGVCTAALLVGCVGALVPLRRVGRIFPAELFRA
ncbi:MAG: ABC transporter permease [Gemmatimonadaceae bacterium]